MLVVVDEAASVDEYVFDALLGGLDVGKFEVADDLGIRRVWRGRFTTRFTSSVTIGRRFISRRLTRPAFQEAVAGVGASSPAHLDPGFRRDDDGAGGDDGGVCPDDGGMRRDDVRVRRDDGGVRRGGEDLGPRGGESRLNDLEHRWSDVVSADYPAGLATPKWAQGIADRRGENSAEYQFRVLGEFPNEADDTLIALRLIEAAVDREVYEIGGDDVVMGVDVARFGNDQTVAIVRRGSEVLDITSFGKSDLMQTTGRVLDMARRYGVKTMHVDEVGVGSGVLDRARELRSVRCESE